jgi:predicted dehydrogenase
VAARHAPRRLAVVGACGWAGRRHLAAARSSGAEVAVIIDPSPNAAALADEHGARRASDVEALGPEVDGVIVALPPALQPEVCARALGRHLPVLCEKPLAPSVSALAPLRDPSLGSDRLLVGFLLRFHPAAALVRHWLDEHPPVAVNVRSVAWKPTIEDWRTDPDTGGVTLINAVHPFDLAPWLLGARPEVVAAVGGDPLHHRGVDDYVQVLLRFPDGVPLRVESYWSPFQNPETLDGGYDFGLELVARDGRIVWRNHRVTTFDEAGQSAVCNLGDPGLFERQMAAFLRAIDAEAPMPIGLEDGERAIRLVEATRDALGAGQS